MQAPKRETFKELLFAAYNIAGQERGVEPGSGHGTNYTNAALKAADTIYNLMENKKQGTIDGVLLAVRLLAETTCADDPEGYAQLEIIRGHTNSQRVCDRGATIRLPVLTMSADGKKREVIY